MGTLVSVSDDWVPEERRRAYVLPQLGAIFNAPEAQGDEDPSCARALEDALMSFGVRAQVRHIDRGPSMTRYHLELAHHVRLAKLSSLADDIALAIAATSVRVGVVPGTSLVAIDVRHATASIVTLRELLERAPDNAAPLSIALGKNEIGGAVFGDLGTMLHLLIGGAPGTGKSVCINSIIASLLFAATPDDLELLLIDPARVELTVYDGIPHLKHEVITDPSIAVDALMLIIREIDQRYERFANAGVRKIEDYHAKFSDRKLPYVIVFIDDLAELMLLGPPVTAFVISKLAASGRPAGIHLVLATQRPSADVIAGVIKANIPSRIAFAVSSPADSRSILDAPGAEHLLGRGEMLYRTVAMPQPLHVQGAYIATAETRRLVDFWKRQANPEAPKAMQITPIRTGDERAGHNVERTVDALWYDAARFLLFSRIAKGDAGVGSTAALQARFSIGHPRAVRLMRQMEEFGIVGPDEGTKPRNVIVESSTDIERIADRIGRPAPTDLFAG